jgi:hypothetical protein
LSNTYFYKRNLFALVSKANLILPSYSLEISYTLNLCSQNILTKNFCMNIFDYNLFLRFVLFYSSSTSKIYHGRYTDLKTEGLLEQKIRDSIFFKTSTLDVKYECYHRKRVSSPYPEIFQQESTLWDKDFKSKERVIRSDEDLNSLDLIGLIGNAQLFVLSCPYLTIIKCA